MDLRTISVVFLFLPHQEDQSMLNDCCRSSTMSLSLLPRRNLVLRDHAKFAGTEVEMIESGASHNGEIRCTF